MAKGKDYGIETSSHGASSLKEGHYFNTKKQEVMKRFKSKALSAKHKALKEPKQTYKGNNCPSCGIRMTAAEANASGHHHLDD